MNCDGISLFLFDLDGTLIDSRADITSSLNLVLARMNMPPLEEAVVSSMIGAGVRKLIERALREIQGGHDPEESLLQEAMDQFRQEYRDHLLDRTRLFPGVEEALDRLSWADFAVVSNKPESFSKIILDGLGIADRFRTILGGDSASKRKPAPEPLMMAMGMCRSEPAETVMVGDSAIDIEAGKNAGVTTCGVLGGFRPKEELQAAGSDFIVNNLLELADIFRAPGN
ncbi:MAG: HAD-IA family hydrolase [Acidobacteria bacterium]|nr:HAD-IA family hydrolase [Acidobacteriota bacterium]